MVAIAYVLLIATSIYAPAGLDIIGVAVGLAGIATLKPGA